MPDAPTRRLPAAAGGLLAACCAIHLILLAAGVGVFAAAAAGATVVAVGVLMIGAMLWWNARRWRAVAKPCGDLANGQRKLYEVSR